MNNLSQHSQETVNQILLISLLLSFNYIRVNLRLKYFQELIFSSLQEIISLFD